MTIDKAELKALADRVKTDRRFCADENHRALAEGVLALLMEIDRLKAENETIRTEAKRQEDGLREMLRRQNKQICALKGKRHD